MDLKQLSELYEKITQLEEEILANAQNTTVMSRETADDLKFQLDQLYSSLEMQLKAPKIPKNPKSKTKSADCLGGLDREIGQLRSGGSGLRAVRQLRALTPRPGTASRPNTSRRPRTGEKEQS
eukprot:TRINITY_DN65635_c0_g1_i1.p1 TRINITY_DN65635_c0_g1~~TRINITY_DN65635_c0_g1_i1.p1  ORF type:complete len:123 (-),score=18.05 TRINITY_DN65635_c0_g1_i1:148-516(-)